MMKIIKDFLKEEDAMGTIEVVVIVAVLVGIALIFKDSIFGYVEDLIKKFFTTPEVDQSGGDKR